MLCFRFSFMGNQKKSVDIKKITDTNLRSKRAPQFARTAWRLCTDPLKLDVEIHDVYVIVQHLMVVIGSITIQTLTYIEIGS